MIGTPATNTVATAMVTANLCMTTSQRLIKFYNYERIAEWF
jgi:hypothetical protein